MIADLNEIKGVDVRLEAEDILCDFIRLLRQSSRYGATALTVDEFYDSVFYPRYEFRLKLGILGYDADGQPILGKTVFEKKEIVIDHSLVSGPRQEKYAETVAHEMAHVILHAACFAEPDVQLAPGGQDEQVLEDQADLFAENFLMMPDLVRVRFDRHYGKGVKLEYAGSGYYDIDTATGRKSFCARSLTEYLDRVSEDLVESCFGVARRDMGAKLLELALVADCSSEAV